MKFSATELPFHDWIPIGIGLEATSGCIFYFAFKDSTTVPSRYLYMRNMSALCYFAIPPRVVACITMDIFVAGPRKSQDSSS